MGRGLSQQQKQILGVGYTVNAYTQNGQASVKGSKLLEGYRIPVIEHAGPKDLTTRLCIYAIGGFLPNKYCSAGLFTQTKRYKTAKASYSRAISRLSDRGLLIYSPKNGDLNNWGYLLTSEGLEIGEQNQVEIHAIGDILCLLGIHPNQAYFDTVEERQHNWFCEWGYGYHSQGRREAINRVNNANAITA